jgi:hypothetical protein
MSAKKVSEMFPAQQILSWKLRLKMSCGLSWCVLSEILET